MLFSPLKISKIVLVVAAVLAAFGAQESSAGALQVFCVSPTPNCVDNGSITPTASQSPEFGFRSDPNSGSADDFFLAILVPDNVPGAASLNFTIGSTHTEEATAASTLVSLTPWVDGQLDDYLGFRANPSNPISAFLPETQAFQASAAGYFAYEFDFGSVLFGSTTDPTFSTSFVFPEGTVIAAFADDATCTTRRGVTTCIDDITGTANSAALLIDSPPREVPEPGSLALVLLPLALCALLNRRKPHGLHTA